MITPHTEPQSLRALLSELSIDLRLLCTQTLALARAEMQSTVKGFFASTAGIAAGAIVALSGFLVLLSALVLGAIALGLPPWAAAGLVGLLVTVTGGATVYVSLNRMKRLHFDWRDTRESAAETMTWLKTQTFR